MIVAAVFVAAVGGGLDERWKRSGRRGMLLLMLDHGRLSAAKAAAHQMSLYVRLRGVTSLIVKKGDR